MREEALLFGKHQSLIGIVTNPDTPNGSAILLLNAGLMHRIGPNRIYVKIARQLAKIGFVVLRFDLSGIGDSKVRPDNLPFEKSNVDDIRQTMDYLQKTRGINQFLLVGHCAGAFHSLLASLEDTRVIGVGLINLEGGDQQWGTYDNKRKVSRYYENYYGKTALTDGARWKKLLTGKADYSSIVRNVFRNIIWNKISNIVFRFKNHVTKRQQVVDHLGNVLINGLKDLVTRDGHALVIYYENSTGIERMQFLVGQDLRAMKESGNLQMEIIKGCDHLFTLIDTQNTLFNVLEKWSSAVVGDVVEEVI
jgi:pimeloyl-ACP methyl ester carboxylesterase